MTSELSADQMTAQSLQTRASTALMSPSSLTPDQLSAALLFLVLVFTYCSFKGPVQNTCFEQESSSDVGSF